MGFLKNLFGKGKQAKHIMRRGGPQSLEDYLFLFPGACPKCGYRQIVDYEEKEYVYHKHGLPIISMETGRACIRCHHCWDRSKQERYASGAEEEEIGHGDWPRKETPRRITSPYLSRKQSDAIPEFPLV